MDEVVDIFNQLSALLQRPELEISPNRTDWSAVSERLDEVRQQARAAVDGLKSLEDPEGRTALGEEGAWILARAGAVLFNAGRREGASLIRAASELDPSTAALRYGRHDPDGFVRLSAALGLRAEGNPKACDAMLSALAKERPNPDLQEVIDGLKSVGTPLKSAPPMFTFNSVGTGLYGHRDEGPDGSYVATLCICALFVPLIPLAAYRVQSHGGGQYTFYSKVSLSPFASAVRWVLLALTAGSVAVGVVGATWFSPARQAERAFGSTQAQAQGQPPEVTVGLWRSYLELPNSHAAPKLHDEAALSLVKGLIAQVPSPLGAQGEAAVQNAAREYGALRAGWRDNATAELFVKAMLGWAEGLTDPAAKARVLGDALLLVPSTRTPGLRAVKAQISTGLADGLRQTQPLRALELYCAVAEDPAARTGSVEVLKALVPRWTLLFEEQPLVQDCLRALGGSPDTEAVVAEVQAALNRAADKVTDPQRQALLDGGGARALTKALVADPDDTEVRLAVAGAMARDGRVQAAEALLLERTPAQWLTRPAQALLAQLWVQLGRSVEAEDLLEHQVQRGLPKLQAARAAYVQRSRSVEQTASQAADRGEVPPAVHKALYGDDEDAAREAYRNWVQLILRADGKLTELREAYLRETSVVSAALDLGRMKLERANALTGRERSELLDEAERVFVGVREESEGEPEYHLSLGTIYHRLQKPDEGEAEFGRVLALNDAHWAMEVAAAYRALGIRDKARQISEKAYAEGDAETKDAAATHMYLLAADIEEQELWLGRVKAKSTALRARYATLKGDKALRDGDEVSAAKAYEQAYREWKSEGETDGAAVNNRALALWSKFSCTGDLQDLKWAVQSQAKSARLQPDSALVSLNQSQLLWQYAVVRWFSRWIDPHEFRVTGRMVWTLLYGLHGGAEKVWVEDRLKSAETAEALRVAQKARTLAPSGTGSYALETGVSDLMRDVDLAQRLLNMARHSLPPERDSEPRDLKAETSNLAAWVNAARARLPRAKSPPAQAAARLALSDALESKGDLEFSTAAYDEALQLTGEAERLWPALNMSRRRVSLLIGRAVVSALADRPELQQRYLNEGWDAAPRWFLLQLAEEGGHEAILERTGADAGMQEALQIVKALPTEPSDIAAWALGRVVHDEALTSAHAGVFKDALSMTRQRLTHHLDNSPSSRAMWALIAPYRAAP